MFSIVFSHLLVLFGGLKGLEASLDADEDLKVEEPSLLFNHYINTCPNQGSATIRTEVRIQHKLRLNVQA